MHVENPYKTDPHSVFRPLASGYFLGKGVLNMKRLLSGLAVGLSLVSGACAAAPKTQPSPVVQALLWQARQYTHIKTIHFQAVAHSTVTTVKGKKETFTQRYEYWGAGKKYRIDYQQFAPHADFDVLVTDDGRHFEWFSRISDMLCIGPTHPIHGVVPGMQNPILEPLVPLAPYFPLHLGTPHWRWVNLARFARNPKSIFNRCRQVRNCGKKGLNGSLHGCISGAYNGLASHVSFKVASRMYHPLVTTWIADEYQHVGSYVSMYIIRYKAFHLESRRMIFLPVAFEVKGMTKNIPGLWSGPFTVNVIISHVTLDKPIPPGKFTINYKLAHIVDEVTGHGKSRKFHYITVHPATRPAPPRERNSNK